MFRIHYVDNGKEKFKEVDSRMSAKTVYWKLKCNYYDVRVEEVGIGMIDECEL